jgi:hypothetical protein
MRFLVPARAETQEIKSRLARLWPFHGMRTQAGLEMLDATLIVHQFQHPRLGTTYSDLDSQNRRESLDRKSGSCSGIGLDRSRACPVKAYNRSAPVRFRSAYSVFCFPV